MAHARSLVLAAVTAVTALVAALSMPHAASASAAALAALGSQQGVAAATSPMPLDLASFKGKAVLFTGAHPDDIASTSAGTVWALQQAGANCSYLVTTNGDKGYHKSFNMTSERLASIRHGEQVAAAAVLGIPRSQVTLLDYEDGLLNNAAESDVRERVVAAVRRIRPAAVFVWSPYLTFDAYFYGMEHPDHRTTGQIMLDAVYPSARDWLAYPDLFEAGVQPWVVGDVYLYAFDRANMDHYVDIGGGAIENKVASLSQHRSQYDNATALQQGVFVFAQRIGSQLSDAGVVNVTLAEAFHHVPMLP